MNFTRLNKSSSQLIKESIRVGILEKGKKINYEILDFKLDMVLSFISSFISKWSSNHVFYISNDKLSKIKIIDKKDIGYFIRNDLSGDAVSVVNPATLDGITYDFNLDGEVSFVITCWGRCIGFIEELEADFPIVNIF